MYFLWCASVLIGPAGVQPAASANIAEFIDFSLRDAGGNVLLPGRLYVPPAATGPSAKPRPFLTFLHGAGANGTNNLAQVNAVSEGMLNEAKLRGAFLYAPQTATNWSSIFAHTMGPAVPEPCAAVLVAPIALFMMGSRRQANTG